MVGGGFGEHATVFELTEGELGVGLQQGRCGVTSALNAAWSPAGGDEQIAHAATVDGRTSDEVCTMLEISPANQRVLLHRGRATVRAHLETYFATAGETA